MKRRAVINRSDLLLSLADVPANARNAVAELLGYEAQGAEETVRLPTEIGPGPGGAEEHGPRLGGRPGSAEPISFLIPVRASSNKPESAVERTGGRWLETITSISEDELSPAKDKSPPPTPALQPWSRLWPYLRQVLGCQRESQRLDVRRLIRDAAELRPIRRLPRLRFLAWADRACILVDRRDALMPFWDDATDLVNRIERLRGREGLDGWWLDEGSTAVAARRFWTRSLGPLKPAAGVPVLVLGDLGRLSRDSRLTRAWAEFAGHLRRRGHQCSALLPCPRDRWDSRLARLWESACWDRGERLPRGGFGLRPRASESDRQKACLGVDQLLALLSPGVRIEPGLLRSLRLLLEPGLADVGTEFEAWHHAEAARTPLAMALLPESAVRRRAVFREAGDERKRAVRGRIVEAVSRLLRQNRPCS
ncbi:MAG: hypothetical protein AAB676_18215 [Verrucomicrobiota bacterium]